MALMKCPKCKSEVGNKVALCPFCGYEVWRKKDQNALQRITTINQEAVSEIKTENYEKAWELLTSALDSHKKHELYISSIPSEIKPSETDACNYIKYIYLNFGIICSKSDSPYYSIDNAIGYFEKSSECGYSDGYRCIGEIYDPKVSYLGKAEIKNRQTAKEWYLKAILLDGNAIALNNLGVAYGDEGDYSLAAFYCKCSEKIKQEKDTPNFLSYIKHITLSQLTYLNNMQVTSKNIETLKNEFLSHSAKQKKLKPVKWIVGIAVLLLCGSLLVRCVGGLLGIGDSDGICDDAGCHSPATCSMGDMEFCLKHYIEWSGRAYD